MTTSTRTTSARKPPLRTRFLRRTLRGLPAALHDISFEADLPSPAADGSVLLADHYFPRTAGDYPTLLVRTPNGRGFPWATLYGMFFAEQGFHVVLQSCRGTGGSGGEFGLWRQEAADGHAAVAWLRDQPWFTGVLGTLGPSYMAYTQWALAAAPPPELKAMVAQVGIHDPHALFYQGGAFTLESSLIATTGLVHQHRGVGASLKATLRVLWRLPGAARGLPLLESYVPAIGERVPFLEEIMTHPDPADPLWKGADLAAVADRTTIATCLITGWDDICAGQTLGQYARLRAAGHQPHLLVGPWTHTSAFERGLTEVSALTLAWLRAHLCDDPSGLRDTPVRAHIGGVKEWRDLPHWPPPTTDQHWHCGPDGLLDTERTAEASPTATFRYDPADPTPSLGGPLLSARPGARDNRALEARDDVLVFTSTPLTAPIEVLGTVSARLRITSPTGHGDIFARLCDVDPQGKSFNVTDGLHRLHPSDDSTVTVTMGTIAHRFAAGHRLRLQVSGGAHPRYARNTGTGEPFATTTRLAPVDLTLAHPSTLILPTADETA